MNDKSDEDRMSKKIENTQRIVDMMREAFPNDFSHYTTTEAMWVAMQQLGGTRQAAEVIAYSSVIKSSK